MTRAFKSWRPIGLFALVFGLVAFSVTAAQAEVNAKWQVNGVAVTETNVQFQASAETEGVLLTKIGLSKLELLCTATKVVGGVLTKLGALSGKLHFEGCITKLNGSKANACTPRSPGAAIGLIETNALNGLIKLHAPAGGGKVPLVELLPQETAFVTLELGSTCALGNKFDITGKSFLKDGQNEGEVDKVTHLVEEGPLSALLFGANPFTIDGSSFVTLEGADLGLKFSGIPG